MTVAIVVTARPSWARVQSVLTALRVLGVPFKVVLTGSACEPGYGDLRPELQALGLPFTAIPSLLSARSDWAMSQTTGLTLLHLSQWMEDHQPRVVVTVADRYETIATAIAAKYQRRTVLHLLGGEVSGNVDDRVRNAVSQLADVHCVATPAAKQRLIERQGVDAKAITVTGCPSVDLIGPSRYADLPVLPGTGAPLDLSRPYGVVLWHPVTTHAETMAQETEHLIAAMERQPYPLVWLWPNVDSGSDAVSKALRQWRERGPRQAVHFVTHLPAVQFLALLDRSVGLIGNSSVGVREAGALGVRVVNLGDRQVGRVTGRWVATIGSLRSWEPWFIAAEVERFWTLSKLSPSPLYGDGNSGYRVAKVIERCL